MDKSPDAFRTISEVADYLETPAHVLRFWESRFPQIKPVKRAGGRRYYRPADVALLSGIKRLLHDDGLTIRGVQKILREQGVRHVAGLVDADAVMDSEAFPPIDALDEVLNPTQPEIVSAEIVPFSPRPAGAEVVIAAESLPESLIETPDPVPDAPFIDTDSEPDWASASANNSTAPDTVLIEVEDESPGNLFRADPAVAEVPPPDAATPLDLWAAAGISAPPAAPPLRRAPSIPTEDDDSLLDVDLKAPLPLASRLRALTPRAVVPYQADLAALQARLLQLREWIAQAAHVRSR